MTVVVMRKWRRGKREKRRDKGRACRVGGAQSVGLQVPFPGVGYHASLRVYVIVSVCVCV